MFYASVLITVFALTLIEFRKISHIVSKALFFVSSGLVFILFAFNQDNADYGAYFRSFTNNNPPNEIGYQILVHLLNAVHLPFQTIYIILAIALFLVFYFYSEKNHASLAALLYLIYPLALDLPQIRNQLMYMAALLTLYLLKDKHILAQIAGFLLSATFHVFGLIYVPFAFLIKCTRTQYFKRLSIIFILILIGSGLSRVFHPYLPEIIGSEIREFDWFYYTIQVIHVLLDVILIWWLDRRLKDLNPLDKNNLPSTKYELMFRFVLYSLIVIPLVIYSTEMYRFWRNSQLIKYIFISNVITQLSRRERLIAITLTAFNLFFIVYMLKVTGDLKLYLDLSSNLLNPFRIWLAGG